jgi:hypothetical protein
MHTNLALPRIFALIVIGALLLFAPRPGVAFAQQAKPAQPSTTPPANPPPATQPANPPAPASPARAKVPVSPREQAWQILEDACGGDKAGDRATAILVLGLIPNDSKSTRLAQKALGDERPEVRAAAAAALGNMQSRVSIPKLKAAMEDQDPAVCASSLFKTYWKRCVLKRGQRSNGGWLRCVRHLGCACVSRVDRLTE